MPLPISSLDCIFIFKGKKDVEYRLLMRGKNREMFAHPLEKERELRRRGRLGSALFLPPCRRCRSGRLRRAITMDGPQVHTVGGCV